MTKRTNTAKWSDKHHRWQINVQMDGKRRSFTAPPPGARPAGSQRQGRCLVGERDHRHGGEGGGRFPAIPAGAERAVQHHGIQPRCEHRQKLDCAYLGWKKMLSLCDGDVQSVLDKAAALGRSKKTIQDIRGMIGKFLKWARRNKKTAYFLDDVHIPASARLKGKTVLQPKDLQTLFAVDTTVYKGKRVKEEYIHAYRFQVLTGLRPGELRGLRKEDIDGTRVFVRRSVNVFGEETRGKNENALRSFVLSELALQELEAQFREYPSKSGLVFDLPSPTAYRERWQKYCEVNAMTKTTPYELRHTFVSVAKTLPAGEVKGWWATPRAWTPSAFTATPSKGRTPPPPGRSTPCLKHWQPQQRKPVKRRPARRNAQQAGKLKKAAPKGRRKPKVC